jgi:hypothetical protein
MGVGFGLRRRSICVGASALVQTNSVLSRNENPLLFFALSVHLALDADGPRTQSMMCPSQPGSNSRPVNLAL